MSHVLAQVSLGSDSGLPEDRIVNTFHFRGQGDLSNPAMWGPTLNKVRDFYITPGLGSTSAPQTHMSSALAVAGHMVKLYDQGLLPPRVPVAELTFSLFPASTATPAEVALCMSFRGPLLSGTNPKRRRGRIYFGPMARDNEVTQGHSTIPATNVMNDLKNAGLKLLAANVEPAIDQLDGSVWVVAGLSGLVDVAHVWVDNAWDTQRRRGKAPTARVSGP
jgi:hypothetical protein